MDCPYCKSVLANASDARPCIARCETCWRHILFFRKVLGLKFSTSEVRIPLPTAIMILGFVGMICSVLLSVLVPFLSGQGGFVWVFALSILPLLGIAVILALGYDGYLAIRTGILKHKGSLIRGRWAILTGVIQIGLSIFVLAFLFPMLRGFIS